MPFTSLAAATTPTAHIGLGLAAVGRPGYINLHRDRDLPGDRGVEALREEACRHRPKEADPAAQTHVARGNESAVFADIGPIETN